MDVSHTEGLFQCRKGWFSSAVTRGNIFNLEFVLERGHDLLNRIIGRHNQVEAAGDETYLWVDC